MQNTVKKDKQMYVGEFEELVLLAIMRLREEAYGYQILKTIEDIAGRSTSIGAIYTTLERLEEKGYITSRQEPGTPERGGRPKRYFKLEGLGQEVLLEAEKTRRALVKSIPGALRHQPAAL
ncbi:MAG: PadR family transcriptional regulator [Abitibacteriaceae bacterium]|nr:PadR family transcriptional regulator [Abditibacteriaceae bacterium]